MLFAKLIILTALTVCAVAMDYTTYIGGVFPPGVHAIATDAMGNTYVTGSRTIAASMLGAAPTTDIFVSKLDASGNLTLLATLGGKASDQANGIAVDLQGNIYIVGATTSTNFPLHDPLQNTRGFAHSGFLAKLSADGTVLYSTYFGGTMGRSQLNAVAVDAKGEVYVTGETFAGDYPVTPGLPAGIASEGIGAVSAAFFAKITSAGDRIVYAGGLSANQRACSGGSSCFTSPLSTSGVSIAVDPAGNAYIAGNTYGFGLPVTPGALRTEGLGAFVSKVNSSGTGLVYLTLLGSMNDAPPAFPGSSPAIAISTIAADAAGNAYITGSTSDPAFPATASAFQTKLAVPNSRPMNQPPPSNAFVAKLNSTGTAMTWATFLGGTGSDQGTSLAVDSVGNPWVSGFTSSTDFPSTLGFPQGNEFLVELNTIGSALLYSARFPNDSVAAALAVDANDVVHAAGSYGMVSAFTPASAPGLTSVPRLFGIGNAAGGVIAGRVVFGELISIYGLNLSQSAPMSATFNAHGFLPTTLAGVQVSINNIPAPLLYVSATQINTVVPVELLVGPATLRLSQNNAPLPDSPVFVGGGAPQVFRNPDGSAAAINQDGTVNSAGNPAKVGSNVSIWATGNGQGPGFGADGQMITSLPPYVFPCDCQIYDEYNGKDVVISYAGPAPGIVTGVTQINFQVGTKSFFYLSVGGTNSDDFSIYVMP
jgi:uncharacterized protein (TIGR03437 family)